MRFADASGDQLGVLGPEVDDEDVRGQWPMPTPWERCSCLALGLQRRREHDLRLLELLQRLVAAGGHRRAKRAEEVEAAVVLVGRSEQDLPSVPRTWVRTRVPRGRVGWNVAIPQWKPASRCLDRAGERRADHDGVGAAGDGLGDVAALAHPAVGDHVHVDAGLVEVAHARAGHVGDGGRLRDADAEHGARGARVARADADEHAGRTGAHEVQRGLVAGAAADDDRDARSRG